MNCSITPCICQTCLPPVTTICMQSWRNSWQDGNVLTTSILRTVQVAGWRSPVWARGFVVCRISPPRFLAECRMRWLNQASFVLLCFVLFAFSGLCLPVVFVMSVFNLSSVRIFQHVPSWMALYSLCVLMWLTLRNYSLTHSRLAGRPRSRILQRNPVFEKTLSQVHFCWRGLMLKNDKVAL